ncbi:MAG: hypothetical protein II008_01395 [Oscillospiraceae bacterium]|nr:hypothetical protein [Oscillospiraceae bacterium]
MNRARSLRNETALNSISPERAGSIMYDTLAYINEMQLQGANPLLISKIYDSVADMEADPAPVSDLDGSDLLPGQLVCIVTGDPDDPEDGRVYRYDGTEDDTSSWTAVGRIGSDPYLEGYLYMGEADPTTDPGAPTQKVFYSASMPGTYANFDGIVVNPGELANLKWDGTTWEKGLAVTITEIINSDKYASVVVDPNGKLIQTIGLDGVVTFWGKVDFKEGIYEVISSENYAEILTDPNGKLIEALALDGTRVFFGPVEFRGDVRNAGAGEFTGRSIAWYGTSIPAGSAAYTLPITGGEIDAYITNYKQDLTHFAAGAQLPAEYPVIVAALLGAKAIFNEAQGSSRICRNTSNASLLIRCKALTNSVQEICSYIWGSYNIDIEHETFEENHSNTIGITTFLTTAGTWSSFVNNVCICLRQSYEICLILRHLLPSGAQRSAFITRVFGSYLSDVSDMLASVGYTMDDLCGYHAADLFVLEHSVNDGISTFSGDVDSTDLSEVEGAYNLIIGTILQYKPSARIAILSNYARTYNAQTADKAAYLKAIAEHWGVPFFDPAHESQVSWNEQLTCGYWDANQIWHDSGFTWVPNAGADTYTSNCNFPTAYSDPSLTAMEQLIHPQQIDGVWYWQIPNGYTWLWDGLHPHSAHDGRLTMLLARLIAGWLPTLNFIK